MKKFGLLILCILAAWVKTPVVTIAQEGTDSVAGCFESNNSFHLNSRVRAETLDVDRFSAIVKPALKGECGNLRGQIEADIRHSSHTKDKQFGTYREHTEFKLGHSYIEYAGSNFTLGLGNRGRYWGVLHGVVLVDLISPVELEEYGTIDFSYTEVLQPQVYFDATLNSTFSIEGFVIIDPKVSEFGLEQELTAIGVLESGIPNDINTGQDYKSVSDTLEGGVKIKFKHGGWNSALIGFSGEQDTFFQTRSSPESDYHSFADERGMIAFNTFKQFSMFKVRVETAYWLEHLNILPHHGIRLDFVDGERWSTAFGLDYEFGDTSMSWQFIGTTRWSDSDFFEDENQRITFLVRHSLYEGRVRLLGFGAYEFDTNHSWSNATADFAVSDKATIEVGVKTFSGPSFSFGGLIETDHIYVSTKYNF